jgi:hypothetical protein
MPASGTFRMPRGLAERKIDTKCRGDVILLAAASFDKRDWQSSDMARCPA